ncbi:sigma-70 family RNA polymerase sigma factor [Ruania alkalisoli]|uniref:Sigma-70 family RNA polymerase sigma factor n=1 Tax=Ruania alkalisoli TaxID=2779775 RepID=A0A7M1SQA5_9MICO|nr:sigma-70 family RNA polymerase sigma factor [Ruania alkalisoli]QOR69736.1 sigma-70 family RNA polymerase sigma factor [Ruania alkalisoli]
MDEAPDVAQVASIDDAEALDRVRSGDLEAFAEIYKRHRPAAVAAARRVLDETTADDAVQVGFMQVLQAVRSGGGPNEHVRAYITTSVRRAALRIGSRDHEAPLESYDVLDDRASVREGAVLDQMLLTKAFRTLPDRWRQVLWLVDVEGHSLEDVGSRFGLNASGAAALAYRARERLRTAWLGAHVNSEGAPRECSKVVKHLAAWQRGKLSTRRSRDVEDHVADCHHCQGILLDLTHASARLNQVGLLLAMAGAVPHLGHPAKGGLTLGKSRGRWIAGAAVVAAAAVIVVPSVVTDSTPPARTAPSPVVTADPSPSPDDTAATPDGDPSTPSTPAEPDEPDPTPADEPTGAPTSDRTALPPVNSPAPAQPSPTPEEAPSPEEPAAPEETVEPLEPPTLVAFSSSSYHTIPELTGSGVPGATVEVLDALGTVVAITTVGPDGTWSALPSGVPAGDGLTFSARQIDGEQESEPTSASAPVDFLAPEITSISAGDEVPLENTDVNNNGEIDDIIVTTVADSGWGIQFRRNGALATTVHEATGSPTNFISSPQYVGQSTLEIRYVDLDSGAEGAWYSVTFQVVDP